MANSNVTLDNVARLAGVSKSTASRILAAQPGDPIPFAAATQEKVRKACQVLGYRPSKLARGLTGNRTGMIGLIVPSVMDSFFPSVTSVIEACLAEQGYAIILANTSGNSEVEQEKIEDLLAWRVDGLIIAPAQETGNAGPYWDLWRREVPFVLIDRHFPDTPFHSVVTDDHAGAAMAVEHLLSTGRKRIAAVGGTGNGLRQPTQARRLHRNPGPQRHRPGTRAENRGPVHRAGRARGHRDSDGSDTAAGCALLLQRPGRHRRDGGVPQARHQNPRGPGAGGLRGPGLLAYAANPPHHCPAAARASRTNRRRDAHSPPGKQRNTAPPAQAAGGADRT